MRAAVPFGWRVADDFSVHGQIVQVVSGDGVTGAKRVLVSGEVPPRTQALIDRALIRVVDAAGYDQLIFGIRRNGSMITPWDRINGERVVEDRYIDLGLLVGPGLVEVVSTNISAQDATAWPGATGDALTIRVVAAWEGRLLAPVR